MKNQKLLLKKMSGVSLMLLLFLFFSNCASGDKIFSTDVWNITYDDQQGSPAFIFPSATSIVTVPLQFAKFLFDSSVLPTSNPDSTN